MRSRVGFASRVLVVAVTVALAAAPVSASQAPVDNVVATIGADVAAGRWATAEANIGALDQTIRNELQVNGHAVSVASNPVQDRLDAVNQRLRLIRADYKLLYDAMTRIDRASVRQVRSLIAQVRLELVRKLNLINARTAIDAMDALDTDAAQDIVSTVRRLRTQNRAVRYLGQLMADLKPAIREAQGERSRLGPLAATYVQVLAAYGLAVGGPAVQPSTPPPAPGLPSCALWAGHWNDAWGGVDMVQNGAQVTGSYPYHNGRLSGTVSGSVLTGTWTEDDNAGTFTLTMSADGTSYSGPFVITSGAGAGGSVANRATRTCS